MPGNNNQRTGDKSLGLPFLLLMTIIVIEYSGIGYSHFPILRRFPLPISLILLIYTVAKYRPLDLLGTKQAMIFLAFIFLSIFAMVHGFVKTYGWGVAEIQIGYFFLFWNAYFIVNTKRRFDAFAKIFVLLHVALALNNYDKFFVPVRMGTFEAGYFLGDGNDFGWGMLIACPFALYLFFTSKSIVWKITYGSISGLIALAVLGTQSRGAFLAMAACVGYYLFYVSKKKAAGFTVIGVLVLGALIIVPGHFVNRMQTIDDYEEDSSAMGRIAAWKASVRMALDNPILGVGAGSFNSAYGREYRQSDDPVRWISTHSVYFKILGEYGFTGFILIITMIYVTWKNNRRTALEIDRNQNYFSIPWILPEMLSIALLAFAGGGVFLGGVNYPHLSILVALCLSMSHLVNKEKDKLDEVKV